MARKPTSQRATRISANVAVSKRNATPTIVLSENVEKTQLDQGFTDAIALRQIAQNELVKLLQAEGTPSAVKAACARTLLELCGAIGTKRVDLLDAASDAETMTLADIDKRLRAIDDDML